MFDARKMSLLFWISSMTGGVGFQLALAAGQLKKYYWLGKWLWFMSGLFVVVWLILLLRTFLSGVIRRSKISYMNSSHMQPNVSSNISDGHNATAAQAFDDSLNPAPGAPSVFNQKEGKPNADLVLVSAVPVKVIMISNGQSNDNEVLKTNENPKARKRGAKRKTTEGDISRDSGGKLESQ